MNVLDLTARSGDVELAGSLWLPDVAARGLLVMHPASGPSDRDNCVYFPPIRAALLAAGVAVAAFDKRGVGGSGGSWLTIGIGGQAGDLLAGLAAASARVPGVPAGVFGHSQGGWVVLEAARQAAAGAHSGVRPAFAVSSSGPAVTMGEQERFATRRALARLELSDDERVRAADVTDRFFSLAERGASHAELLAWASDPAVAADVALVTRIFGDEPPPEPFWDHIVRLAAFDPVPALRAIDVPLLAVFGADDAVTPVVASVAALREHVDPALLRVAVLPGGDHRLGHDGSDGFVEGYPDVVVEFVLGNTP